MAMFNVGEAWIEDNIFYECFACDIVKCKGACCTLPGGRGAPVRDDEVDDLNRAAPSARKYLPEENLKIIDTIGVIEGEPGSFATPCINQKDCVFVFYQDDIARCSFERAFLRGEISWRKPISCHLFPIRISYGMSERLYYEQIRECSDAREKGSAQDFKLYDFLKDALIRKYGERWYDRFREECQRRYGLV